MRQWAIFYCIKDECWVVCRSVDDDPDTLIGVAECPDAHTARVVLEAMRGCEIIRSAASPPSEDASPS
jgi:hypothetical protein